MHSKLNKNLRTARDEIVPSRYVVNVGDIEVIIISDGILTPPAESMATNADPKPAMPGLTSGFSITTLSTGP